MSRRAVAVTFGLFVAIGMLWALAMPPNAAADEDQHMIWAASTARWQLEPEGARGGRTMKAPDVLYTERCWQLNPYVSVACQDEIDVDPAGDIRNKPVRSALPYYAIVGAASLPTSSVATVYLMRFAHVLLTASILTLGVWSMSARRPTPGSIALGTVAFTPIAAFLFGTVNPSGVAIAAGFALWAGGLFALRSDRSTVQQAVAIAVPIVALVAVRRDAIVWVGAILAVLAVYAGRDAFRSALRHSVVRWGLVAVPAVIALSFVLGGDTVVRFVQDQAGSDQAGTAASAFGILPYYIEEYVGRLGWIDVLLPDPVLMGWYGLLALCIVVGVGASRRHAWAMSAVVGLSLLIPFLFGAFYRYRYFQGRYGVPLAIGVPLIASAAMAVSQARHLVNARMARVVVWTVATLSSVAFVVALHRFTVGRGRPWPDMVLRPEWSPPLPTVVLVAGYGALMAGVAVILCRLIARAETEPSTEPVPVTN